MDGFRQQELQILNPSYPDPAGGLSSVTPVNRYLLDPSCRTRRTREPAPASTTPSPSGCAPSVTYRYMRGSDVLRGENLNAPD